MGLPIVVVVNKSDILERDDKGKDWDSKQDAIKYSLRQMCINCNHQIPIDQMVVHSYSLQSSPKSIWKHSINTSYIDSIACHSSIRVTPPIWKHCLYQLARMI